MKDYIKKTVFKQPKKIPSDPFIRRLRASVIGEGMLPEGNIYLMDYAIKNMPEGGIVFEIGSYAGLSTNVMLHLLKKNKKKNAFFGCDAWVYEGFNDHKETPKKHMDGRTDIDRISYMQYIKSSFIEATQFFHGKSLPHTCHMPSDQFFEKWNTNQEFVDVFNRSFHMKDQISFSYIDGNHSYKQAKKDFINVDSKLKLNGFVLLDDSAKTMKFGSVIYVKEILQNPSYKLIDCNPNYLFQKIK